MRGRLYLTTLLFFVLIIPFILSASNTVSAASDTEPKVYDYAKLLNTEEIEKLEALANKYGAKRETDLIILTTNDTEGKDVVEYMQDFYDDKAPGYDKPHGNTAILTIDMEHRDVYLAGFYKAKVYLDDSRLDLIRDKITPDLSSGNYYDAFSTFIKTSYKYMGIRPGVDPDNPFFNLWFQLIVSVGVGGAIVGFMLYTSGGRVTVNEGTYRDFKNSRVLDQRDDYIRTTVTKRRKPSQSSGSGRSSGGGGGGMTGGGHSHSGSRGKF
ncbi:YgcG family protein [Paenibacillus sp. J2TS4]|uniref:TPM domain-containing protein n=1 Tax=Paenibacillus sp. J2TS4 TaxID=2807194 RepID=UPI0027952298|nr:TPM domain-containing protein [Paenibacillus sp. J2TS4]